MSKKHRANARRKARVAYRRKMCQLMRNTRPFNKRSANRLCRKINGEEIVKSLKRTEDDHWSAHFVKPAMASVDDPSTSTQNPQPPIRMIFRRIFKEDNWQKRARPLALKKVRKSCARTSNAMSLLMTRHRDASLKSKTKLCDFDFTYAFDNFSDSDTGERFDGGPRIANTVRQRYVRQECSPDKCQGCTLTE